MFRTSHWSLAAVAALVIGCGSAPKPEARLASSQGAIRGASEAGADTVPKATLYLKLAEEQRQKALELINAGEMHRADMLLARAEADAELAIALARESVAKAEAEKAADEVRALKRRTK